MNQNDTSFRMSLIWAPWEYAMLMCLLPFSSTIIYLQNDVWHQNTVYPGFFRVSQILRKKGKLVYVLFCGSYFLQFRRIYKK
jgi:hypothetical protein